MTSVSVIGSHLASDFIYEFQNPCAKFHEKKTIHIRTGDPGKGGQPSKPDGQKQTGQKSLPESTTRYQTKETTRQFPLKDSNISQKTHDNFYSVKSGQKAALQVGHNDLVVTPEGRPNHYHHPTVGGAKQRDCCVASITLPGHALYVPRLAPSSAPDA